MYKGNMHNFVSELNKYLGENNMGIMGDITIPSLTTGCNPRLYVTYFPRTRGGYGTGYTLYIVDDDTFEEQVLEFVKRIYENSRTG